MADLLRGDYKQSDYGKVILPFTVLRRLGCVLEPTKPAVLAELAARQKAKLNPEPFLLRKSGHFFQYLAAGLEKAHGGPGPHWGKPPGVHAGVLPCRAGHFRELRFSHPD